MPLPSHSLLSLLALATTTLASSVSERQHYHHLLVSRDYADEVCSPNTTTSGTTDSSTIPPCIEVVTIEAACAPNASSPLEYLNHAECMCQGSYFQDWQGCQDCLYFHGLRTEREEEFYESVMSIASHSLCDFSSGVSGAAEPTAPFASLFNSAAATAAQPTTGATVSSDQAPSQTAVSLYFTLSGSQGPGGTIASYSASLNSALTSATKSSSSSKSAAASASSLSAIGSSATTSSSGSGAYPTKASAGLVLGLAGVAMAVGL